MRMFAAAFAATLAAGSNLEAAPLFTLKQLDGSTFRLADHIGKEIIVLDFWATWCGPCTKALKKLQELHERFPRVLVAAVSIDDGQSVSRVSQYVQGRGFTFTVLLDPDSNALHMFNPAGSVPTTVVLDRKGIVTYNHVGYLSGDENTIAEKVREAGP